jgi:enoyl-CoA hydratase
MDVTARNLLCEVTDGIGVAVLNRPNVLNVIDLDLIDALYRQLTIWERDPAVRAVVVRGDGTRAFCAGGDVRAVWARRGDDEFMDAVYRREYMLDDLINRYPKPYIAFMSGIVMGGGCGISVHGRHRVVTETTDLAMPECKIGLFPDIAGSYFLARCPDNFGLYMGLTGLRVGGADAIRLGLADNYVPMDRLDRLVAELRQNPNVGATLAASSVALPEYTKLAPSPAVSSIFGRGSVEEIVQGLKYEPAAWAKEALESISQACPFSLVLTFRAIREATKKSVRDCLKTDFRIAQRVMLKDDYFEGVRALIIDKDNKPLWNPARVEDVDASEIDACFAPLENEMTFPDFS